MLWRGESAREMSGERGAVQRTNLVDMDVEDSEERVRIAFAAITLDGGTDEGLGKDEVGKVSCV